MIRGSQTKRMMSRSSAFFSPQQRCKANPFNKFRYISNRSPVVSDVTTVEQQCSPEKQWSPEFTKIIQIMCKVRENEPTNCREHFYKKAILHRLYEQNIAALDERPLYSDNSSQIPILVGSVDLEVANKFVFELKVGVPSVSARVAHRSQLLRYLHAYKKQHIQIEEAAIIYFLPNCIKVVICSLSE